MKISMDLANMRYIMAHVHSKGCDPSGFTVDTLLDVFAILIPPAISFPGWCEARGIEVIDIQTENAAALEALGHGKG